MERIYMTPLIHIFLASAFTKAEGTWTIFQAKQSLDGKSCNEADLLFEKILPRSKLDCLIECVNHVDCVSVFQTQHTGECAGCRVGYDLTSSLIEVMDGSKYYVEQRCPTGWTVIANSCYFITKEASSFEDGINECLSGSAHAVIMNDESEHNNIKAFINSMTFTNDEYGLYTAFTNATDETWTPYGLTDPLLFDDWLTGEPSYDSTENCLVYFLPMNLQWIDVPCNEQLRMICEKEI